MRSQTACSPSALALVLALAAAASPPGWGILSDLHDRVAGRAPAVPALVSLPASGHRLVALDPKGELCYSLGPSLR